MPKVLRTKRLIAQLEHPNPSDQVVDVGFRSL